MVHTRSIEALLDELAERMPSLEQRDLLDASLSGLWERAPNLAARALVALAEFDVFRGDRERGLSRVADGLRRIDSSQFPDAVLRCRFLRGIAAWEDDDLVGTIIGFNDTRRMARALSHPMHEYRAIVGLTMATVLLGDTRSAREFLDEAACIQQGIPERVRATGRRAHALVLLREERFELAEGALHEMVSASATPRDTALWALTMVRALVGQGRVDEAAAMLDKSPLERLTLSWEQAEYHYLAACIAWSQGRADDALAAIDVVAIKPPITSVRFILWEARQLEVRIAYEQGDAERMWRAQEAAGRALREVSLGGLGQAVRRVVEPVLQEVEHLRTVELRQANDALRTSVDELKASNRRLADEVEEHRMTRTALEETHRELVRIAHMAGMAEVATGVLHDLGNALNSVATAVQLSRDGISSTLDGRVVRAAKLLERDAKSAPRVARYLVLLAEQRSRATGRVVSELDRADRALAHAGQIIAAQQRNASQPIGLEEVRVTELVEDAITLALSPSPGIQVQVQIDDNERIVTAPLQVVRVLVNLLTNARDALSGHQPAHIGIRRIEDGTHDMVLDVSDTGPGIPASIREDVFRHGFSTKKSGFGFGLHASATTLTELGGGLELRPAVQGEGACFRVRLPRAARGTRVDLLRE